MLNFMLNANNNFCLWILNSFSRNIICKYKSLVVILTSQTATPFALISNLFQNNSGKVYRIHYRTINTLPQFEKELKAERPRRITIIFDGQQQILLFFTGCVRELLTHSYEMKNI